MLRDKNLFKVMPGTSLYYRARDGQVEGGSYRVPGMRYLYDNLSVGGGHLEIPGTGLRYFLQVRVRIRISCQLLKKTFFYS